MSSAAQQGAVTGSAPQAPDGKGGRWAVVVAALCVVATFAANLVFFQGYLDILRLPGDMPPVTRIPDTPATHLGLVMLRAGLGLFVVATLLGLVGLVGGVRLFRSPDGFRSGVWAIALVACTPVLTIMLLSGMGAT